MGLWWNFCYTFSDREANLLFSDVSSLILPQNKSWWSFSCSLCEGLLQQTNGSTQLGTGFWARCTSRHSPHVLSGPGTGTASNGWGLGIGQESNPGLPRGWRETYHWATDAPKNKSRSCFSHSQANVIFIIIQCSADLWPAKDSSATASLSLKLKLSTG